MLGFFRTRWASPFSCVLALAVAGTVPVTSDADAKPARSKSKKGKKKKGPSMDDTAGQDDGAFAPGTDDSKAQEDLPPPPPPPPEPIVLEETPEEPEEPPPKYRKNWLSLTVQQDVLWHFGQENVCPAFDVNGEVAGGEGYSCLDADKVHPSLVWAGAGNDLRAGFGLATTRVLVGYDRVLGEKLTLGGRVGWAFNMTPTVQGLRRRSLPLHVELRTAYYFGDAPFERDSVRPFVSLGVGIGEIDGVTTVEYYDNEIAAQLHRVARVNAWRRAGTGFGALGGGLSFPLSDRFSFNLEARAIVLVGSPALAAALAAGIAYGM